ncbi:MAG TPA: sugar transferase [Acidimicrobiales bacterium]|nr:sugar transferase [Acidimicrobiales bacterium]
MALVIPESGTIPAAIQPTNAPAAEGWRTWRTKYAAVVFAADVVAVLIAVAVTSFFGFDHGLDVTQWRGHHVNLALLAMVVWPATLAISGAYRRHPADSAPNHRVVAVTAARLAALSAVAGLVTHDMLRRDRFLLFFASLPIAAIAGRWVAGRVLAAFRSRGRALNSMVLAGDAASVARFTVHLRRRPEHGYRVVAACLGLTPAGGSPDALDDVPVLGTSDEVVAHARRLQVDTVAVVGHGSFADTTLQQVAWELERSGITLLVAPDVADLAGPRIRVTPVTGLPLLHISEPRVGGVAQAIKNGYERCLAALFLLVMSPLLLAATIAIKLDSPGPVFFRQERVGRDGHLFGMVKFRSMVHGADAMKAALAAANEYDGALFKIRSDPRVTRVGRVLRKYSVDELPQLWNVVRGHMALIGPRPCLAAEAGRFTPAAHRRFRVRPGLTGLWQVSGRSDLPWEEAVRLDLYYVENWSPSMDLRILVRTVRVVVRGAGAY